MKHDLIFRAQIMLLKKARWYKYRCDSILTQQ